VVGLSIPIVVFVASAIIFAPLAAWFAHRRARSSLVWLVFGAVLGPAALAILVLAPPGQCPACHEPVAGWPRACANCGFGFGGQPIERTEQGAARVVAFRSPTVVPSGPRDGFRPAVVMSHPPPFTLGSPAIRATGRAAVALLPDEAVTYLGSGVYMGGSVSLQVGSRYGLVRAGSDLHVLGPIHVDHLAVAARVPVNAIEPSLVGDRLLIAPVESRHGPDLAFGNVLLDRHTDVVQVLTSHRPASSLRERPSAIPTIAADSRRRAAGSVAVPRLRRPALTLRGRLHNPISLPEWPFGFRPDLLSTSGRLIVATAIGAGLAAAIIASKIASMFG
jgi:hypothetical protein